LGTPFEGRRELLDIPGFTSEPGKPLPNDDLDLQLIWLTAMEEYGPFGVNERILGEYWLNYIPPHWNEYGLGKSNMKAGLPPPLSGDHENVWKHSNGAWIRSEIWACCMPGRPDLVTKYAYYDACVDHGTGEGTYAELFTATLESAAFVESDRIKLIEIGLSYIPEDCRVARSVRMVLDCYKSGKDWKDTRAQVLDDSEDLGWFQAPANVAFTMIGWLYGEGDYKKSLLIAINCGDDTDCTGATLGSIMGIIGGYDCIPKDWIAYVGDDIISVAIDRGSLAGRLPNTCTELANRVIALSSQVLAAYRTDITVSDAPADLSVRNGDKLFAQPEYKEWLAKIDGSIVYNFIHTTVRVKYINGVAVGADKDAEIEITCINNMPNDQHFDIAYYLPESLRLVKGAKHMNLMAISSTSAPVKTFNIILGAGEFLESRNRGVIQIVAHDRPTVILIPILLFGE